ncbi:hypothetical protein Tco_0336598 [Tanacetum coccineum]
MDFLKKHQSSKNSHLSISDTDSQLDEFHSPLRANSPHLSDLSITTTASAIVTFRSPLSSTTTPPLNVAPIAKTKSPAVVEDGGVWRVVRGKSGGGVVGKLGLGFRVVEMVVSLVAFSVMASDRTYGWSGDSFDRYIEYRFFRLSPGLLYSCGTGPPKSTRRPCFGYSKQISSSMEKSGTLP